MNSFRVSDVRTFKKQKMFHPNTTVTVTWDSDGVCASWLLHGWIQIHSEREAYIMHNVLHEEKLDENLVGSTVAEAVEQGREVELTEWDYNVFITLNKRKVDRLMKQRNDYYAKNGGPYTRFYE